ncbi:long-chain-fatty-acid--CoA ligase [Mobilicoccus caccae]|uniref:Long-chain-fatty-acid--CoA ligase n=1 Tax=Mobilicoccus caccae TaxID=1859295 RepID=A0ABQ6IS16_9MICO|nr:long-chain fatty acid--CoA ligase [Mobilicoccus caccae]GMA39517.1 long-chain-fatty-acid--CoA ligase [Mobilicoccus caccae]
MNLAQNLARTAAERPDVVALKHDDDLWSFARLADASARFAAHLRSRGVAPGDRVALSLPNIPAFAVVYYGALSVGAVIVPMNPLFKPREVTFYLQDAGVRLLVCLPGSDAAEAAASLDIDVIPVDTLPGLLAETEPDHRIEEADDEDTAVLLYTSGTTGSPKGAELRHRNLESNQRVTGETLMEATEGDVVMGCLPLFHVFGMTCAMNMAISAGVTLTLIPRFEPKKALEMLGRDGVTIFIGVPTMYGALLAASEGVDALDVGSLRLCISGGSSMPVELMKRFEQRFDCVILEGYGLSETSPVASFNQPHIERKPGSIGVPVRGVEMKLIPVDSEEGADDAGIGEIAIRGENIMRGYWNKPEATEAVLDADGWFRSGDLGRVDEDGYYYIVDRAKDLIIRGGYNVYPREVEEVLYEYPGVAEAAVVGIHDDHYGEEIAAYVVAREGSDLDVEELQRFVKERVAAYKYPRVIRVIEELPKGATGKILKRELRQA